MNTTITITGATTEDNDQSMKPYILISTAKTKTCGTLQDYRCTE